MRTGKALLTATFAAICLLGFGASEAAAATGPCGPAPNSPRCHLWYGTVTFIGDGDTVSVRLDDHKKDPPVRVRVTGIQAMEEYVYTTNVAQRRGDCQANEATARVEYLIHHSHNRVQLAAQDPASNSGGRPRRQVRVLSGGRWRDVSRILLNEGLVLPLANRQESALNATYSALGQRAAAEQIGIWNSYYCGPGPEDLAYLRVWVNSDPPGNDDEDPNREWVKVKNLDPSKPIAIGGWWMRDSGLRRYTFPAGTTVPAGGTITMFVGRGTNTASDFFWGESGGVFDNATSYPGGGDGAYLFDTEGDLRAWQVYPCRYKCTDPLAGKMKVVAHPTGTEYVKITNTSKSPFDLESYQLVAGHYNYPFPAGTILQPGETLRVDVDGDPAQDQPLHKYWGIGDSTILYNAGGSTRVSTFTSIVVGCDAWGTGSCPSR
jgi:endonuclease YncB( thermonuclease family)